MQRRRHDARRDGRIRLHESLRGFVAFGLEDHQPEPPVHGLVGSPGEDQPPALSRARQVLEVRADGCAVGVGPGGLGAQPRDEVQDVDEGQKDSRAAPSPSVNVFG